MKNQKGESALQGYLLSIAELFSNGYGCQGGERTAGKESASAQGDGLLAKAFARVDCHRRERAAGMRPGGGQASVLGAGLLLQLAVAEAMEEDGFSGASAGIRKPASLRWKRYGMRELLVRLDSMPLVPLCYVYGARGKPYLKNHPYYFSISHSGEYVLCVLSRQEIGADIQQHRGCDIGRLADRFFSEKEKAALERGALNCEAKEAFFRLWARKEAYGKLTGDGIGDAVGISLLPGEEELPERRSLIWEQTPDMAGYSMAVCRYRNEG